MFWGQLTRSRDNVDSDLQALLSSLHLKIDYARLAVRPPEILTFETVFADAFCYMQLLKYKRNTTVQSNAQKRRMRSSDLVREVHILVFADIQPPTQPRSLRVSNGSGFRRPRNPTPRQKCTILEAAAQFIGVLEKVDAGVLPRSALKEWFREGKAQNNQGHEEGGRQGGKIMSMGEGKSVCECLEEGEISEDGHQCDNCTKPKGGEVAERQGGSKIVALTVKPGHDRVLSGTAGQEYDPEPLIPEGHGQPREQGSALGVAPLTEGQYRVDQALRKIDGWADEWLMGISNTDEDWMTFGDCLEQPDL
ncbi:hypothetical protein LTR10_022617 [Elasticomyces elasticus]|uniref:BHLH domain-containing protein n=1 Tax=Exophiala sideris TaxID=1016849 RepID=A0ABR0J9X8_9EURO|nr:hypothetical protein LTR10_022617 [Elasticomyces elasticus]KAK5026146.1 hypothetical protein LTS07_007671 [Exophiala sideris]KAK5032400.1 hypothetical protein LTR13_007223 [Exophiala sideris]KAK5059556.1 hypothetical protein LTR69_006145 [Exophiala sideris]KAK5178161.1 hypothetical protein LTR44_009467 [Eurotiomycetes sp. CCFEE 6388]